MHLLNWWDALSATKPCNQIERLTKRHVVDQIRVEPLIDQNVRLPVRGPSHTAEPMGLFMMQPTKPLQIGVSFRSEARIGAMMKIN
jgi:hypothetical protein